MKLTKLLIIPAVMAMFVSCANTEVVSPIVLGKPGVSFPGQIKEVVFSPDGQEMAVSLGALQSLCFIDVRSQTIKSYVKYKSNSLFGIAYAGNNRLLIRNAENVTIFDTKARAVLNVIVAPTEIGNHLIKVSSDGKRAFVPGNYDLLKTAEEKRHNFLFNSQKVSMKERDKFKGKCNDLFVIDVESAEIIKVIENVGDQEVLFQVMVSEIGLNEENNTLLTKCEYDIIREYDLNSYKKTKQFKIKTESGFAGNGEIFNLADDKYFFRGIIIDGISQKIHWETPAGGLTGDRGALNSRKDLFYCIEGEEIKIFSIPSGKLLKSFPLPTQARNCRELALSPNQEELYIWGNTSNYFRFSLINNRMID